MAHLALFRCQKHVSPVDTRQSADVSPTNGIGPAPASRQCLSGCAGIGRRLVRKLKKQSKVLCAAAGGGLASGGGTSFQFQYDPLSYSRNFDGCCAVDDDSSHFYYTFSARFARPLASSN